MFFKGISHLNHACALNGHSLYTCDFTLIAHAFILYFTFEKFIIIISSEDVYCNKYENVYNVFSEC